MTEDERKMLSDLADKLANTPTPPKDPDAETLIRTRIGSRPDALYLMTQTVLIQNIALQQAQAQIQQLQAGHGNQLAAGGSFLGGPGQGQPQGQFQGSAPRAGGYNQGQPSYGAPPPSYAAPSAAAPSPGFGASGSGSFLRGAAQTAAGVAAGALAFEGIEHLFSHGGGGFGGGGLFGGGGIGGYGQPMGETVVNNYYDNAAGDGGDYRNDQGSDAGGYGQDDYQAADNASGNDQYDSPADDGGQFDDGGSGGGFDGGGDNFA